MTVCIASSFSWNYGPNDLGRAILTASDRKITYGDMEYEPNQTKVWDVTPKILMLVAGDMSIHSEAIVRYQSTASHFDQTEVGDVARRYGSILRTISRTKAADTYLSPIGLDIESFISRQHELKDSVIEKIMAQLQYYSPSQTEAIVVGATGTALHIYEIAPDHQVICRNDVGFAAIGSGAWAARAQLITARYGPTQFAFGAALLLSYAAKKQSELACGVGSATDMNLVTRFGHSRVAEHTFTALERSYKKYQEKNAVLAQETIAEVESSFCLTEASPDTVDWAPAIDNANDLAISSDLPT